MRRTELEATKRGNIPFLSLRSNEDEFCQAISRLVPYSLEGRLRARKWNGRKRSEGRTLVRENRRTIFCAKGLYHETTRDIYEYQRVNGMFYMSYGDVIRNSGIDILCSKVHSPALWKRYSAA